MAFEEDREILEAVQRSQDEAGVKPTVRLAIDNGPNRSRRIVDKILRDERATTAEAPE